MIKKKSIVNLIEGRNTMNSIELKTLGELSQYSFYIPAYQRGYRWTAQEVNDLLNDINEFIPREISDTEEKTWYCLQPVVVKSRSENEYEVIDGQQRLTTIYLILHYLNQDFVEKRRDKLFSIDYQTRTDSKEFLQNPDEENDACIDFYYMHKAYGQQRLTTLFLLHWYAFVKENNADDFARTNLKKFSYETRLSSRRFCEALLDNTVAIDSSAETISEQILDSKWFFISWKHDSTIRAMLRTIDTIHYVFKDIDDIWESLVNRKNIVFHLLILENFGLSDDLYIKMNARGRLLTPFENLKAEIQDKSTKNDWESSRNEIDKFSYKIDGRWTHFLWQNFKKNNSVDNAHMNFITTIVMAKLSTGQILKGAERIELIRKLNENNSYRELIKYIDEDTFNYIYDSYELYGEGLDSAVEKMKCVVKSESTYRPLEDVQNLTATAKMKDENTVSITIEAKLYAEANPTFAFACSNSFDEFSVCFNISDGFTISGKDEINVEDKLTLNARTVHLQRTLKPNFPFVFEVSLLNTTRLNNVAIYVLVDATRRKYKGIPIVER